MPLFSSFAAASAKSYGSILSSGIEIPPNLILDFDETTTLDSRITFTRASSGTFFNSSGVLTTASSNVARFDHRLENGIWVNKGLLIEEQRVNRAPYSENFGNSWWNKQNVSVTNNAAIAPNGSLTADQLKESGSGFKQTFSGSQTTDMTAGNWWTGSIFIKPNGRTKGLLLLQRPRTDFSAAQMVFDLQTGYVDVQAVNGPSGVLGGSIVTLADGWFRVILTGYTGYNTDNRLNVWILDDNYLASYTPDNTSGFFVWGAQLEQGAFATSYTPVPTSGSTTRAADVASMTGTNFSDWYNATEGTSFIQFDSVKDDLNTQGPIFPFAISDNSNNERWHTSAFYSSPNELISNRVFDGNVLQAALDQTVSFTTNTTYKNAFAVKANNFAASTDGASVLTDTSGTMPTVDRLYLGVSPTGNSAWLNGRIAKFYYWNTRKTNQYLQNITR